MKLTPLNFAENYQIRLKQIDEKVYIFCSIRKKWFIYTPEEWVRQHILHFLIHEKKYSRSAIKLELPVILNGMRKRSDITVYKKEKVFLVVECKAPSIEITQSTFDQIARYNLNLDSEYLMVSNGLQHYYCRLDYDNKTYVFLKNLPNGSG